MNWRLFLLAFFLISLVVVSVLQVIASIDGILHFFGLHWVFALLAAILLVFIPILGPIAGVYGAVAAWGWSVGGALLLFFWPYILYGALVLTGFGVAFWKIPAMRKYTGQKANIIDAEYVVKKNTFPKRKN